MEYGLNKLVNGGRPLRPAFTLVELMIVIFILAVLVAIIVSISGYVTNKANEKDTAITQAILMNAIQAWRDANPNKTYPSAVNGQELINQLTVVDPNSTPPITESMVKAATEILLKLSKEAWPNSSRPVLDAWGRPMDYQKNGGLGGTPVIISAGQDYDFNTDDDIRSDEAE